MQLSCSYTLRPTVGLWDAELQQLLLLNYGCLYQYPWAKRYNLHDYFWRKI